ncbi:unnamed protein product, partial [Owenia fusiformis]
AELTPQVPKILETFVLLKMKEFVLILLCCSFPIIVGYTLGPELIKNGDFENAINGEWYARGCKIARVNSGAHKDSWCGSVSGRSARWGAMLQNVQLEKGRYYYLRAAIKYTNTREEVLWDSVQAMLTINLRRSGTVRRVFGVLPQMREELGWQLIGGDVLIPNEDIASAYIFLQPVHASINYNIDSVSMREIIEDPQHETNINMQISTMRKGGVELNLALSSSINPSDIEVEVSQKSRPFAFGSAVQAMRINSSQLANKPYQDFYYKNFEWAVLENALKWRQMERKKGQINYGRPEIAVDSLREHGIPVRGHCVSWGVDERIPDWIRHKTGPMVRKEVTTRINGVVDRFKGRLVHWDVNNEDLHGFFFEQKTGNANFMTDVFREVEKVDGNVKLFVNDFQVISSQRLTFALANQVRRLREEGVDVHVGVQGHFRQGKVPPPGVLQRRLDTLAEVGAEIWITEHDIEEINVNTRADLYEQTMKVFYAHPAVKGVLLWGFWDQAHWRPSAALAEGPNCQANAAGRRWQKLVKNDWMTDEKFPVMSNSETISLNAFHGNYDVTVRSRGTHNVLHTQSFAVKEGSTLTQVDVNVSRTEEAEKRFFENCLNLESFMDHVIQCHAHFVKIQKELNVLQNNV